LLGRRPFVFDAARTCHFEEEMQPEHFGVLLVGRANVSDDPTQQTVQRNSTQAVPILRRL
jgi:hypothetical protein